MPSQHSWHDSMCSVPSLNPIWTITNIGSSINEINISYEPVKHVENGLLSITCELSASNFSPFMICSRYFQIINQMQGVIIFQHTELIIRTENIMFPILYIINVQKLNHIDYCGIRTVMHKHAVCKHFITVAIEYEIFIGRGTWAYQLEPAEYGRLRSARSAGAQTPNGHPVAAAHFPIRLAYETLH